MTDSKAKQKLFDIKEYSEKVKATLIKLKSTQQPGQKSGKGNKTDVLQATKMEISDLVKEGYTVKQIADALSNDIFGILPKTITQMMNEQAKTTAISKDTKPRKSEKKAQPETSNSVKSQGKKPVTEIGDVE